MERQVVRLPMRKEQHHEHDVMWYRLWVLELQVRLELPLRRVREPEVTRVLGGLREPAP